MRRAILSFIFLTAASCSDVTAQSASLVPDSYKTKCQLCHGATGLGDTPYAKAMKVAPFNDPQVLALSDSNLLSAISNGSGKMPAFKGKLSDNEMNALLAYIRKMQNTP